MAIDEKQGRPRRRRSRGRRRAEPGDSTAVEESPGGGDAPESRSKAGRADDRDGGEASERPPREPVESSVASEVPTERTPSEGSGVTEADKPKRRSRRRGRKRGGSAAGAGEESRDGESAPEAGSIDSAGKASDGSSDPTSSDSAEPASDPTPERRSRRGSRRRGGRSARAKESPETPGDSDSAVEATEASATRDSQESEDSTDTSGTEDGGDAKGRSRRRRKTKAKSKAKKKTKAKSKAKASSTGSTGPEAGAGERIMLMNVNEPEEVRVAILDNGQLDDLLYRSAAQVTYLNNIYLGRVVNIEPSIGAAFVDFGGERNGFLHESDIIRPGDEEARPAAKGERRPIQSLVRKGETVLVQITKDGIGSKGPTLTTNISIPGRYLVLMPHLGRTGVSRKIPDKDERKRLKSLLGDLNPPADLGVIIRTAGMDRTKTELQKDLKYLQNLWEVVSSRIDSAKAPATIYQESDLVIRTIRDYFTSDVSRILVDSPVVAKKCRDFLGAVMPRYQNRVEEYDGARPLFHEFRVEPQIEQIYERRIELPSGGSVVIEPTEALVAVDVNSGKYRENEDPEETAYRTDLEAIPVIVRQIRLRDLGGLLIIDFIDMQDDKHKKTIEREMRAALKKDRARTKMTKISEFGVIEITRQRVREGLGSTNFDTCTHCRGAGKVKTVESQILAVTRQIRATLAQPHVRGVEVALHPDVAHALLNRKRRELVGLEERFEKRIHVVGVSGLRVEDFRVTRTDGGGRKPLQPGR